MGEKEKDETFLRNDVIADKNLKAGAKSPESEVDCSKQCSWTGCHQARQEFEITEIDDQGFVKIKGGVLPSSRG